MYLPFLRHRTLRIGRCRCASLTFSASSSAGALEWVNARKKKRCESIDRAFNFAARGRATGIDSSPIRRNERLSFARGLLSLFLEPRWTPRTIRHDESASRDAHTREARNRLARLARRDLRPLRQRHLLHTDAAPAVARPPVIALPCDTYDGLHTCRCTGV